MPDFSIEKRMKELGAQMDTCLRVTQTLETEGWKTIIEPLIDKSIGDIVGAKMPNGRWHGGLLSKARKDEKREYYVGYKQALIDLHGRIHAYKDGVQRLEAERRQLIENTEKGFTQPMIDDTSYGRNRNE